MPANKYALIRYRVIDELLSNKGRPFPSKEELRSACEEALYGGDVGRVSISTIEKDIYAMRYDTVLGYEAPIAFHSYHKGYHYTDPDYTIKKIPLGEEDVEALHFAAQTFWQFKDLPVFHAFGRVLDKLKDHISSGGAELETAEERVMLFEDSLSGEGERHLPEILNAIQSNTRLDIRYTPYTRDQQQKRYRLEPYLLKEHRLRWYLLAKDLKAEKLKTFGLDRIEEVEWTEERFLPPGPEILSYFDYTHGISHVEGTPERILLEVDHPQSYFLLSRPLHHSQRLVEDREDGALLELTLIVNRDICNELLTWSPHIRVREPGHLRKALSDRALSMVKKQE